MINSTEDQTLPKNVKILTWNYDYHFVLAAADIFGQKNLGATSNRLNIYPKIGGGDLLINELVDLEDFAIVHLNGMASMFASSAGAGKALRNPATQEVHLRHLADYYEQYCNGRARSLINFAWERDNKYANYARMQANRIASNTEILIVIGYSFPDVNTEIDSKLLREMKNIERIYIHDKNPRPVQARVSDMIEFLIGGATEKMIKPSRHIIDFNIPPAFYIESEKTKAEPY